MYRRHVANIDDLHEGGDDGGIELCPGAAAELGECRVDGHRGAVGAMGGPLCAGRPCRVRVAETGELRAARYPRLGGPRCTGGAEVLPQTTADQWRALDVSRAHSRTECARDLKTTRSQTSARMRTVRNTRHVGSSPCASRANRARWTRATTSSPRRPTLTLSARRAGVSADAHRTPAQDELGAPATRSLLRPLCQGDAEAVREPS